MNNSYSGNFFPSPLSGKFTLASTPKKTQKKLPRNIDVLEYLEDPSLTILRENMLRAKSFDSVSTQDLERLYWHLRDYSYYCGRISNYDEALETEKLLEYVFLELKDRRLQSKSSIYSEILNPTFFQNQQMKYVLLSKINQNINLNQIQPFFFLMWIF